MKSGENKILKAQFPFDAINAYMYNPRNLPNPHTIR